MRWIADAVGLENTLVFPNCITLVSAERSSVYTGNVGFPALVLGSANCRDLGLI